ncbi:hypothetical protein RN51_01717 [Microbacterium oxydans]|uniref:Uncharacterized protein n=1 Tax=Microbacterium oxydans TaxID=82380 RepID=A0A0F0KUQ5_9MICO|nr:hypothetical protein RN51_01717 [Microbacterium oxydans]
MAISRTSSNEAASRSRLSLTLPYVALLVGVVLAVASSWGLIVLVASIVFALLSLRRQTKARTLLVVLIVLASFVLLATLAVSLTLAATTGST